MFSCFPKHLSSSKSHSFGYFPIFLSLLFTPPYPFVLPRFDNRQLFYLLCMHINLQAAALHEINDSVKEGLGQKLSGNTHFI